MVKLKCCVGVFLVVLVVVGLTVGLVIGLRGRPKQPPFTPPPDSPVIIRTNRTYYVDQLTGDDANDGTSPATAWKTVAKSNTFKYGAGDSILFRRGSTWRERIRPQSGLASGWLYYGAYDSGAKPLFVGSVPLNDPASWISVGQDLWRWSDPLEDDVGNLYFNSATFVGVKKWAQADAAQERDFYWDRPTRYLYLHCSGNPASAYTEIEGALGQHMLYTVVYPPSGITNLAYIVFEDLALRYGGGYAVKIQNCHHIHVRNCDISWMGGAEVTGQPKQRYGNGIEFFGLSYYNAARGKYIYEMYDTGFDYQAVSGLTIAQTVLFEDNVVVSTGLAAVEMWARGTWGFMDDVNITGNTFKNVGGSWGASVLQRKPGTTWGLGFMLDETTVPITNLRITNNTIQLNSTLYAFYAVEAKYPFESQQIDKNIISGPSDVVLYARYSVANGALKVLSQVSLGQFSAYQSSTQQDLHSLFYVF